MKEYIKAELEIIEFSEEDIIRTSTLIDGGSEGTIGGEGGGGDAGIWKLEE